MRCSLLLAILAIGCAGAGSPARSAGVPARVVADGLDLFVQPSGASYTVGALDQGDTVQVLGEKNGGWLAIEPPEGAFVWVNEADLEDFGDGQALVSAPQATVRAGRPGVRLPGPTTAILPQGTSLTFLDIEPLRVRARGQPMLLRAVSVPPGLRYYVRADGVERATTTRRKVTASPSESPVEPAQPGLPMALATIGPRIDIKRLGPSEASMLRAVEDEHRAILRQAIDRWHLERVRVGYQDVRSRVTDAQAGTALEARLSLIERQSAAAAVARSLERRLEQSRDLDRELGAAEQAIAEAFPETATPFDAVGLVQPSSRLVDGQRVFALVGADGRTTAYLRFPPGVLRNDATAQRVGVRGTSRYDETLQTRVIEVRELESLGRIP